MEVINVDQELGVMEETIRIVGRLLEDDRRITVAEIASKIGIRFGRRPVLKSICKVGSSSSQRT